MDALDHDCTVTLARIATGQMPLAEFISWVADHRADAFAEGRESVTVPTRQVTRAIGVEEPALSHGHCLPRRLTTKVE